MINIDMIPTDLEALKNIPDGFYWFKRKENDKNPEIVQKDGTTILTMSVDYYYNLENKNDLGELQGFYMRINPPDKFETTFAISDTFC